MRDRFVEEACGNDEELKKSLLKMLGRLVELPLPLQGNAQIVMGLRVIRLDAQGPIIMVNRRADLPLALQGIAQTVVHPSEIRINPQGLLKMISRL